jgi:uncharacterized protein (DUF433 family)
MGNMAELIQCRPELMHGTPCFVGTRVPVKSLFDYLEAGDGLEVFLDQFPTVPRQLAVDVLEASKAALLGQLVGRA